MKPQFAALRAHLEQTIVGQSALIDYLLIGILADGHLLLEGLPGLAKTTAVRTLAEGMALRFARIQFTPDLIPGDITGSDIFLPQEGRFRFVEGPIFNEVILADEINRAPPKVQSALLEAMQERQVTASGVTRPLEAVFLVIATQNPIEQEGTYSLPEAQMDRFLMKVTVKYPNADEELEILRRENARLTNVSRETSFAALTPKEVLEARRQVNAIYMDDMLARYIVAVVSATRNPTPWPTPASEWFARGASPRATLALARAARARAFLRDRDFVEPGDILDLAFPVLNHRVALSFRAKAEGVTTLQAINTLLEHIPVP